MILMSGADPLHLKLLTKILSEFFECLKPVESDWSARLEVILERSDVVSGPHLRLCCTFGDYGTELSRSLLISEQELVELLSEVQYRLIEETRRATPDCPGHSHPLELNLDGHQIVWNCPSTGQPIRKTNWNMAEFQTNNPKDSL
jgi:hypothetical protein